jgi:hypothetical protein
MSYQLPVTGNWRLGDPLVALNIEGAQKINRKYEFAFDLV